MLSQLDIIAIYTVSSQTYIQVNNFLKHQTINRPTASKYPDPSMDTHGGFNEDSLPKEDKEKGKEIQEKGREENPGTPSSDGTHAPLNAIVESYNRYCISLPRVKTITDKRQKTIRSRWRTYSSLDIFDKVFQMAQASDFLSGRNGKWTGCNFDWLINENNMVKVLEGNYENKKQKTGLDALKELYDEDDDE
jgi:hypothetical protein